MAGIAEVEVKLSIRAEDKGVDAMVVIDARYAGKQEFAYRPRRPRRYQSE